MRDNFDSKGNNNDLNKRRSYKPMDESLFETIQFTEEELRKIRQPNNQPLDGDYFADEEDTSEQTILNNAAHARSNQKAEQAGEEKFVSESDQKDTNTQMESLDFVELKGPPAPSKKQIISAPEDSEFHYKSPIKARLEMEEEAAAEQEDIEYWDEYEKSEFDFWQQADDLDEASVEHSSRVANHQGPASKLKQFSEETANSNRKFFNKLKRTKQDEEIAFTQTGETGEDQTTGVTIVDKVKSLLNSRDAVNLDEFIQDKVSRNESPAPKAKKQAESREKSESNILNRAKTAFDARLSRSVEKGLAADLTDAKAAQSQKSAEIEEEIKEVLSKEEIELMAKAKQASQTNEELAVETLEETDISHQVDTPDNAELSQVESKQDVVVDELVDTIELTVDNKASLLIDAEAAADLYSEKVTQQTQRFSEPILTDQVLEEVLGTDDLTIEDELEHQSESFVKGAAWLTIGSVFSRILGALYIIPWSTWLGTEYTQANTLYSAGYTPYSLFLAIATAGFPSAIAKQMAFYHSKKEYRVADKLFKNSIVLMLVSGLVSGGLLYLLAPSLASITSTDNPVGATLVIRSLVPALLILPLMSILRGYFQGFNDMVPSAISQIIEQIARVFYLLAATYAIMRVYRGEVTQAVVHSTFAAFIGALAALIYLAILYFKRLPMINKLKERSLDLIEIDFKESIRIMFMDSVPFILLGSGIILAQVIDTYTFKQILLPTTVMLLREISELYGAMSLDVNKLVMIVVSLAVALASSVVPLITSKFAAKDIEGTSSLIEQIVEVFSFVMLPAAIGMIGVSNNLYAMFYPQGHVSGTALLITGSIMSISLGLYTVLSTVLQSMNFRRLAVRFLMVGLLVKVVLQVPLVAFLHAHGAMIATTIAFAVSSVLMWIKIQREVKPDMTRLTKAVFKIMIGTLIMGIAVSQWNALLDLLMGEVGRFLTFVKVMLGVGMGIFVYGGVMGLLGQLSILLGDKKQDLQEKMRMF